MNYIKNKTNYDDIKLKEIEYGLVSIYLMISKLIIISTLALILGIFKEMIIFTLIFNTIRSTAFGLHATKSWVCLIISALIFLVIPTISLQIHLNVLLKIIICFISIILIYKNSPADTKSKPIINKKRRNLYKLLSTLFGIIFSITSIIIKNEFISNCLIFSLILENLLISPLTYKIFKLPYNNYIDYLKKHPELT